MPRLCGACAGRIEDNQHFKECSICHRSFHLDHRCDEHPHARMVVISPRYIPRRPEPPPRRSHLPFRRAAHDEPAETPAAPAPDPVPKDSGSEAPTAPTRRYRFTLMGVAILAVFAIIGYGGAVAFDVLPTPFNLGASDAGGGGKPTPDATATPAKSKVAVASEATRDAQLARAEVKFGPAKGRLSLAADASQAETSSADASLRDPIVQARFENPSETGGNWDYGFVVRHTAAHHEYRIVITSRGEWICERFAGDADVPASRQHGEITTLRTGPGQVNNVLLMIIGDSGLLFVNDSYAATVDLSQAMQRGDVRIGAGFFPEHRSTEQVIGYSGFQVSARGGHPKATPTP